MNMTWIRIACVAFLFPLMAGCGGAATKQDKGFFTSGSREADQRAQQRMARAEQLKGNGEGSGQKAAHAQDKQSLFDRLGGDTGIKALVDDFTTRALADPRVNWERKGVKRGTLITHGSATWNATPANVEQLKKHLVQFFSLATGGPAKYDGKEIKDAHAEMHITNAEFDASVGDLKSTLDKLQIPNQEQKELLAIVESTRPQVVQDR